MGVDLSRPGGFPVIGNNGGVDIFKAAYLNRLIGVAPGNLIAYWPMDETVGVVSNDYSGRGHNGAYTGVTLNNDPGPDGRGCPRFDGVNDVNNIYSLGLLGDLDFNNGACLLWVKVFNAAVWADATTRFLIRFFVDANNRFEISKPNVNNRIRILREGSGTTQSYDHTISTTSWFSIGVTYDTVTDEIKVYFDGVLATTMTVINTFVGNPLVNGTVIGAANTTSTNVTNGWLAHGAFWNRALSEDDMALLGRV